MLGSLLGLGASVGGQIPGLIQGDREKQLNRLAQGRGPSAAQTMLLNQGAQNARNAQSVAASQPGGLGLLQGLRSAENANRDAAQQAGAARVQEQLSAVGAAKQAHDQRMAGIGRIGAAIGAAGAAQDASTEAANLAEANRKQQIDMQRNYLAARFGTSIPQTQVSPAQRNDLLAARASQGAVPGNAIIAPTTTIHAPQAQPVPAAQVAPQGAAPQPSGTLNTNLRGPVATPMQPERRDYWGGAPASADPKFANPLPQDQAFLDAYDQQMAGFNAQYSPAEQRLLDLHSLYMATPTSQLNRRYGR